MGVYIKGMEMPMSCRQCSLYLQSMDSERNVYENCAVTAKSYNWGLTTRPSDCPLVPVPQHGRLGDLDKLEQVFVDIDNAPYSGFDGSEPFYSAEDAAQIIRLSPTIIQAEEGE